MTWNFKKSLPILNMDIRRHHLSKMLLSLKNLTTNIMKNALNMTGLLRDGPKEINQITPNSMGGGGRNIGHVSVWTPFGREHFKKILNSNFNYLSITTIIGSIKRVYLFYRNGVINVRTRALFTNFCVTWPILPPTPYTIRVK